MKKVIFGCMLLGISSAFCMTSVDVTFERALEREHAEAEEVMAVEARELQDICKHICALKHLGRSLKWDQVNEEYRNAFSTFVYEQTIQLRSLFADFARTVSCLGIGLGSGYDMLKATNCDETAVQVTASVTVGKMIELKEVTEKINQIPTREYQYIIDNAEMLIRAVHDLSDEQKTSLVALVPLLQEQEHLHQKLMKSSRPYAKAICALTNLTNKLYLCELTAHGKESDQERAQELTKDVCERTALQHSNLSSWYATHVEPLYLPRDKQAVRTYFRKLVAVEYTQEDSLQKLYQELQEKHEALENARVCFQTKGPELLQRLQAVTREIEQLTQKCQSHAIAQELITFFKHAVAISSYRDCIEALNQKIQAAALGIFVPLSNSDQHRLNLYVVSLSNLLAIFTVQV